VLLEVALIDDIKDGAIPSFFHDDLLGDAFLEGMDVGNDANGTATFGGKAFE
jgi:hypothetical protein